MIKKFLALKENPRIVMKKTVIASDYKERGKPV